jgi:hypothetical protein
MLFWHMLTKREDYAFARPSLTTEKLRRLELSAGAPTTRGKRTGARVYASSDQYRRELAVLTQAEAAHRRLVADRTSHGGGEVADYHLTFIRSPSHSFEGSARDGVR